MPRILAVAAIRGPRPSALLGRPVTLPVRTYP